MDIDDIVFIANLAAKDNPLGIEHLDTLFNQVDTAIYYRFIYHLIQRMKPELTVELGVLYGRCTAHMARAHTSGLVMAIDCDPKPEADEIAARYGNIRLLRHTSIDTALLSVIANRSVDLLLIDTVHEYDHVLLEIGYWLGKMKKGGVILLDDVSLDDGMIRAWKAIQDIFPQSVSLPNLHHSGFGAVIV